MIDKDKWREFGQDTGVTPLLFTRSTMRFLVTTESQDLDLTSYPKDSAIYSSGSQTCPEDPQPQHIGRHTKCVLAGGPQDRFENHWFTV